MTPQPSVTTHKLVVSRSFAAPRDRVWRAWTEPQHVQQWLGLGQEMRVESVTMDLRVGGKFRIQLRAHDGEYFTAAGTYLTVQAPERLVYTWDWEKDGAGTEYGELEGKETLVSVQFQPEGAKTKLVLTHENFISEQSRDRHETGWTAWFTRMATFLEGTGAE
jgi:uncharacterized protein YndB with AHSA1/START domain